MRIKLKRHVFGIMVIPIGKCDCDQDYCLTCEAKFRAWCLLDRITKFAKKG